MPIRPNVVERLVLLRLNRGPAPMLDLFGAAAFESVSLALDLNRFEALAAAEGPLAAEALADRIDAHPEGTTVLCEFLVAEGYLATAGDGYRLTGMTEKWLLDDVRTNMGPWLAFWNELVFPFWERELEPAVRTGEPSLSIYDWFDEEPGRWAVAQAGFRASASLLVEDVTEAVTVPDGATRVLDVGGGHGLYAMEHCRRHPVLSATICDLQGAVDAVRDEIPADISDRVRTRVGDYRTDDLGDGYDLALVFIFIHGMAMNVPHIPGSISDRFGVNIRALLPCPPVEPRGTDERDESAHGGDGERDAIAKQRVHATASDRLARPEDVKCPSHDAR